MFRRTPLCSLACFPPTANISVESLLQVMKWERMHCDVCPSPKLVKYDARSQSFPFPMPRHGPLCADAVTQGTKLHAHSGPCAMCVCVCVCVYVCMWVCGYVCVRACARVLQVHRPATGFQPASSHKPGDTLRFPLRSHLCVQRLQESNVVSSVCKKGMRITDVDSNSTCQTRSSGSRSSSSSSQRGAAVHLIVTLLTTCTSAQTH